jgi:ABC-2 type transport system ATP-binding protein
MNENVIETKGLTVYYGSHRGVIDLDLEVRKGEIFGFLGPNGAGKTTTIRVLMDIIRPNLGRASIFGQDCQKDGVKVRERVGYLPGELSLPRNATGRRYLKMVDSLREKKADPGFLREICARLNLDTSRKIREYSSGNKQKLGLVSALMNKADLMVLDEPTIGLDPLMQQSVLELVLEAKEEGRTVFFCSHILSEVQTVCDRVGIIREGKLIKVERIDALTAQPFQRLKLRFDEMPAEDAFAIEGVKVLGRDGNSVTLEVRQNLPDVMRSAADNEITDVETQPVTLEEVFMTYYGRNNKMNDRSKEQSAVIHSGGNDV